VRNKAQKWVFAALLQIRSFPIIGIDSDNGSEFINWHLLRWCEKEKITFTRSRSGNRNRTSRSRRLTARAHWRVSPLMGALATWTPLSVS